MTWHCASIGARSGRSPRAKIQSRPRVRKNSTQGHLSEIYIMQGTLVLTILAVQSSYLREIEEPLDDNSGPPDTPQWGIAPTGARRIRTYAIDHDIHIHAVGPADGLRELALENTQTHYGDVILSQHVIELADWRDRSETAR